VALCWGVGTGWLPVVLVGGAAAFATAVVVAWTAARMFINTVYFDLGDVAGDRQEGVATIPVRFGFHATRRFLYALDLLSGAGLLGLAVVGRVPPSAYAMSLITLYSGYYLWRAVDEETDLGFLCDVVADAEAFVVGALATGLALGGVA
jgi:4-hydroxybenzoate polyprenyltransferase